MELFIRFIEACSEGSPRLLSHLYYYGKGEKPPGCLEECYAGKREDYGSAVWGSAQPV